MSKALRWGVLGGALVAAGLSALAYRTYQRKQQKAKAAPAATATATAAAPAAMATAAAESKTTFWILQHSDTVPPAIVLEFLQAKGVALRVVALEREPLPAVGANDVVVSLGGHMGAYDDALHAFIGAEKQAMREWVARDVPVLGICLGAQLLADALGGKAFPAASFEGGLHHRLELTAAAAADPVMRGFVQPVLLHHGDTFTLPPGATLLAQTVYPQAFRIGSAFAVQFHPEARLQELDAWSATASSAKRYASVGLTRDGLLADAKARAADQRKASDAFFDAWWAALPAKYK